MKLLVLTLLLSGCGDWQPMDCTQATVKTATITWVRTDDPASKCATLPRGGACIAVSRNGDTATATLYANAPDTVDEGILGHEVKHAFGCVHA